MFIDERVAIKQGVRANLGDLFVSSLVGILPDTPVTNGIKSRVMTLRGAKVGKRVKLLQGISIDRFWQLEIGDDVSIASNVLLIARGGIKIGDRSMIGHGSKLVSASHNIPPDRKPIRFSGAYLKEILIGNDVWIGVQSVILPGVTVGEGAIVAAGAVATKDVEPFTVVGGVPARLIRVRD